MGGLVAEQVGEGAAARSEWDAVSEAFLAMMKESASAGNKNA